MIRELNYYSKAKMTRLDEASLRTMMSSDEAERLAFKRTVLSAKEITEYAVQVSPPMTSTADRKPPERDASSVSVAP